MMSTSDLPAHPRHVFAVRNHVFVSPNSTDLPDLPVAFSKDALPNDPLPNEGTSLRWSVDAFPFLPFGLQSPRYHGPLLQRLSYRPGNIPVQFLNDVWILSRKFARQWQLLENCLISVTRILFLAANVTVPVGFKWFKPPSEYFYLQTSDTRQQMIERVMNARDAFIPLMAICSYAIAFTPNFTHASPPWTAKLREEGIHPEWVSMLEKSQLADFSPDNRRLGVFLQPTCNYLDNIPRMLRANIPIWFCWDNPRDFAGNPWVYKTFCPTSEEVCRARVVASELEEWRRMAEASMTTPVDLTAIPSSVSLESHSDSTSVQDTATAARDSLSQRPESPRRQYPVPGLFSDQRRGESMEQYFERRAARHARMEHRESPAARQSRLDREREACRQRCPGLGSNVKVFTWEDVDGFLMRTHVIKAAVEDCWSDYTVTQRRYNGFDNEWDLATQFDPGAVADDDSDYDDDDDTVIRPSTPLGPPPYPPSPPPPTVIFTEDIATTYATGDTRYIPEGGNTHELEFKDPQEAMIYWRYGFNWDGISTFSDFHNGSNWTNTQMTLTDTRNTIPMASRTALSSFVDYLVQNRPVPAVLWDLDSQNPTPLRNDLNPAVRVKPLTDNHVTYYFIQSMAPPSPSDPNWDLVVQDPVTALECYRRDMGPSIISIATSFLLAGKPFSTRIRSEIPRTIPSHPSSQRQFVGLGWREQGYKGDINDYAAYENQRAIFLAHPRLRAALLKGGIVWRLARHSVELSLAIAGPSDEVFEYGNFITDSHGTQLWDDDLGEDELNLICGVYNVRTQARQTSDSSWWPKQAIWMSGGLNVGYWSPTCETWFQKRLTAIRNGSAALRTAAEWRTALRFWRPTTHFIKHSSHAAATFLHDGTGLSGDGRA
jgi:hypothetical protein